MLNSGGPAKSVSEGMSSRVELEELLPMACCLVGSSLNIVSRSIERLTLSMLR